MKGDANDPKDYRVDYKSKSGMSMSRFMTWTDARRYAERMWQSGKEDVSIRNKAGQFLAEQ